MRKMNNILWGDGNDAKRSGRKLISLIEEQFTEVGLHEFKKCRGIELDAYHFGLGTWIRNTFIYPDDSLLRPLSKEKGVNSPDNMSGGIIRKFHACVLNRK